jgi:hypothetical protein
MAKISFKMPTDRQIWAEVDARLESIPAIIKARDQFDRQTMFDAVLLELQKSEKNTVLQQAECLCSRRA